MPRVAYLLVTVVLGVSLPLLAPPAAQAAAEPQRVLAIRDSSAAVDNIGSDGIFVDGIDGLTLTASRRSHNYGGVTRDVVEFQTSGSASRGVTVDAVTPGTYAISSAADAPVWMWLGPDFNNCYGATGTLTVFEAVYEALTLQPLVWSADYDATCGGHRSLGQLRWNSTVGWGQLQRTASPAPPTVQVNGAASIVVGYIARGTRPSTLGRASVSGTTVNGYPYFDVIGDLCSGRALLPGETCSVTVRVAPKLPYGLPEGTVRARVTVPDGRPAPAPSLISASIRPLAGQPVGLLATPLFRRLRLSWGVPVEFPAGYDRFSTVITYNIYRVNVDGTRSLVTRVPSTGATTESTVLSGLTDAHRATYVVTADMSGLGESSAGVSAVGTTSVRELLWSSGANTSAVRSLSLAPVGPETGNDIGDSTRTIAISADQRFMAFDFARYTGERRVAVRRLDGTGPLTSIAAPNDSSFDSQPALSPNGSMLVFTRAATADATPSLALADTTTGATTQVPGSTGLSDASFISDGSAVVAVETLSTGSRLVRVTLSSGARTIIPGSTGASQPAVGDTRVAYVYHPDAGSPVTRLAVLPLTGGTPSPVPGVPSGEVISSPAWTVNGLNLTFASKQPSIYEAADAYVVALTGSLTRLTTTVGVEELSPVIVGPVTAPTASLQPLPATTMTSTVPLKWTGGATSSGISGYDLRERHSHRGGALSGYVLPASWQGLTSTTLNVSATAGYTYCYSVRSHDRLGNVSAWTGERCTTIPIDDRSLSRSSAAIAQGTSASYWKTTYTRLVGEEQYVGLPGISARQVAVLGTTCPTCGTLDVYLGGVRLGSVSFAGPTAAQQFKTLPTQSVQRSGVLVLRATSAKPVYLDAVTVRS